MRTALSCAVLIMLIACSKSPLGGPSGATEVKDTFSHACTTDDDCTIVFFGNTCGICSDSNGAISKKERDAYQKAHNEAHKHCPPERVVGECAVSYGVSQCTAGKCSYLSCQWHAPKDEHHCQPDGG